MMIQCCLCKKVLKGRRWVEADKVDVPEHRVSHGYCPVCAAEVFAEIEAMPPPQGCAASTTP